MKGKQIPAAVKRALLSVCEKHEKILSDPAPFARVSGHKESAIEYTVRAWVKSEDYWDVYFALMEAIPTALGEAGIGGPLPAYNIVNDK